MYIWPCFSFCRTEIGYKVFRREQFQNVLNVFLARRMYRIETLCVTPIEICRELKNVNKMMPNYLSLILLNSNRNYVIMKDKHKTLSFSWNLQKLDLRLLARIGNASTQQTLFVVPRTCFVMCLLHAACCAYLIRVCILTDALISQMSVAEQS